MIEYYKDFSIVTNTSFGGYPTFEIYSGRRERGNEGVLQVSETVGTLDDAIEYIEKRWYRKQNRQSVLEEYEVKE